MGCAQSVSIEKFPYAKKIDEGNNFAVFKSTYGPNFLTAADAPGTPRECFLNSVKKYGDEGFLGSRYYDANGEIGPYVWQTYKEVSDYVDQFAAGLVHLGCCPEVEHAGATPQKVFKFLGTSARNRWEYLVAIQATYRQGITLVPLYDTLGPETVQYIGNQTKLTTIACEGKKMLDIIKTADNFPTLKNVITFEKSLTAEIKEAAAKHNLNVYTFDEVCAAGKANMIPEAVYDPETTVNTICYTSGTTGLPKGAVLTHGNFMGMAAALTEVFEKNRLYWGPDDIHISYLPFAHVLERVVIEKFIQASCKIGFYRGDTLKIVDDVKELKPTIFISVPRLLNRVFEKVSDQLSKKTGIAKTLIAKAFAAKTAKLKATGDATHSLWDKLVFSKTKEALGGRVKLMFSGSAPMSAPVIDFLKIVFCCPFIEGYGMTETTCAGGITHVDDAEAGHIGGLLSCIQLKVQDIPEMGYTSRDVDENGVNTSRGEICLKGSAIFKGYFLDDERTKEVIDADGWFHTGDVCKILPSGAIKIIDRAKNIFKLAQGEYVAPEKVENFYIQAPALSQAFVFGYSTESCVVGICVPNFEEWGRDWAKKNGLGDLTDAQLCENKAFKDEVLRQAIAKGKENGLHGFEQIKAIHLVAEPFSIENDLLTPSFKLKRHVAREIFKGPIDAMYASLKQN